MMKDFLESLVFLRRAKNLLITFTFAIFSFAEIILIDLFENLNITFSFDKILIFANLFSFISVNNGNSF